MSAISSAPPRTSSSSSSSPSHNSNTSASAVRKRRTDFATASPVTAAAVAADLRAKRKKSAAKNGGGVKNGVNSVANGARRRKAKTAAAVVVPNPFHDRFDPSSAFLHPLETALETEATAGRRVVVRAHDPALDGPLPENSEAIQSKDDVDLRVRDLLRDDEGEEDEEKSDRSVEAANETADRRAYARVSDAARLKANEAMAKSNAASAAGDDGDDEEEEGWGSTSTPTPVRPAGGTGKNGDARRAVAGGRRLQVGVQETGRDTIQSYTKTFSNHELLSREAEALLGRQIQILVKWEERRQQLEEELLGPPTYAQWASAVDTTVPLLKKQIRKSHRAKAALVEANLRLVVTVARQTVKKHRTDIDFHDACQEGIVGLTRACEKFDPDRDFRFSTYAVWWIKGQILRSVADQSGPIRLPANVRKKINDLRITERVLMAELGRRPNDDEVAERAGMTPGQLAFYRKSARDVMSIDQKVGAGPGGKGSGASGDSSRGGREVGDTVSDAGPTPSDLASSQMLKDDVRRLIRTLSPKEQAVIRLRFGLDDGTPRTVEQIARKFQVGKERIKKIEARALLKLRQPYRNKSVECYVSDL